MFDAKEKQEVPIRVEGGDALAAMSFPKDDQWAAWRAKKPIKQKDFGRRSTQMQKQLPGAVDLRLFREIFDPEATAKAVEEAAAKGEKFVPYVIPEDPEEAAWDAAHFISRLEKCTVVDAPTREGNCVAVTLKVPGGHVTKHVLRVPTTREQHMYESAATDTRIGAYGISELIINYRASADLYDKLKQRVEGYVSDVVPMPHKAEAIAALMGEIRPADEDSPE